MSLIKFDNVSFSYRLSKENGVTEKIDVIENLNLEIEEGSFVAVLGHNGSGKSTIAKLINGILTPQQGTVCVNGRTTEDEDNIFEIRKNVGMVRLLLQLLKKMLLSVWKILGFRLLKSEKGWMMH